jgi:predicted nucleic acid-binding protein
LILYLDTSALVKLYVQEDGTGETLVLVERSSAVYTVRVSYAEARAAFARQRREGGLTSREHGAVVRRLDAEWNRYGVVEISDSLVRRAGALCDRRALRAYDGLQLAAALELRDAGAPVEFACFDGRLIGAARAERLAWALA